MTICPLDGTERVVIDAGPGWAVSRCPFCQQVSEERAELPRPTPTTEPTEETRHVA